MTSEVKEVNQKKARKKEKEKRKQKEKIQTKEENQKTGARLIIKKDDREDNEGKS